MGVINRAAILVSASLLCIYAQTNSELRFCIRADPKTFDPLLAEEEPSEVIRFLTGGVLIRFNRHTQRLEPELATSWQVLDRARRIDFVLRRNVRFSNGAPFGPPDVVATFRRIMSPGLQSPVADSFRSAGGTVTARVNGSNGVSVLFSTPVAGLEMLFDQLAISPAATVAPETAVLGPFVVAEHKGGQYVLLKRNPHYWKTDAAGRKLPYAGSIRLDIQANRQTELLRFRRGEVHMVDKLEAEAFDRLRKEMPSGILNAGPSLDSEFLWFNERPDAAIPEFKRKWFASKLFRHAISATLNRADIVRLVYRGYAYSAVGPVSPANRFWFNSRLPAPEHDPQLALKLLQREGFRLDGSTLRDRDGNAVEFSLITNAGNRTRTQIGTMVQQDLMRIGVRVNFVPIEFQSLIERITKTQQYESCLLGMLNIEIDPNSQMNVWMSSGTLHAWNPAQPRPATAWESEIDTLMQVQHTATAPATRKKAFDRVQEIIAEQEPIIYLVHPDVLLAVSPAVRNCSPSPLMPHLYWNAEYLAVDGASQRGRN